MNVIEEVNDEIGLGELMPRQVLGILERVVARPQFEELAEAAPTLAEVLRVYEEDLVVGDGELAEALVPAAPIARQRRQLGGADGDDQAEAPESEARWQAALMRVTLPPATLYVYRWRGRSVFMRLGTHGGGRPGCPVLYDAVYEVPVVQAGEPPPRARMRRVPLVADWLADLVEEEGH